MRILDLTLPLDGSTPVYAEGDGYRDPAYLAEPWASVARHGYSVHRLQLGTHTGTHLDAPAHFHPGGRTVDQVPPSALVGQALVIDARSWPRVTASALEPCAGRLREVDLPLFLAPEAGVPLAGDAVAAVVGWRPRLILYAGLFIDEGERYHHNRVWLGAVAGCLWVCFYRSGGEAGERLAPSVANQGVASSDCKRNPDHGTILDR